MPKKYNGVKIDGGRDRYGESALMTGQHLHFWMFFDVFENVLSVQCAAGHIPINAGIAIPKVTLENRV